MRLPAKARPFLAVAVLLSALFAGGAVRQVQDTCGPFTDVSALFCPYVLEAYYTGITAGTSATTFSPDVPITRGQAAVFTTKALNQALARGSRRAALGQWWDTQNPQALGLTTVGTMPTFCAADGADIWVSNAAFGSVSRVRASDGKVLDEWPNVTAASGLLVAMGRVFVGGGLGTLFMIDPSQASGTPTTVASGLGTSVGALAFDGARIWTANGGGSISIVTPGAAAPWTVTNVTKGFAVPTGVLWDGAHMWVSDEQAHSLFLVDASGAIVQTIPVPGGARPAAFDGANLWVPSLNDDSVVVVRASTGTVLATLTGNGLSTPAYAAFDGQRVIVVSTNDHVSLWRAADLAPLGSFLTVSGSAPETACSDGINFWITFGGSNQLARF
jgi:hypothetical protein